MGSERKIPFSPFNIFGSGFLDVYKRQVLLHGFEEWKEDLLPRLRGMFAFAIWDKRETALFLARDNFGIKPMHYTLLPDGDLLFGSEIKSLLAHPDFVKEFNPEALDNYLSFQYSLPRDTFFKGVYCLQPGHYLWFKEGKVKERRYFESVFRPDETMPLEERCV